MRVRAGRYREISRSVCCGAGILLLLVGLSAFDAVGQNFSPQERNHWSFQPVRRPDVPRISGAGAVENPIDAFLFARLKEAGLDLAPPAPRRELIRRLSFDLTGLPPTPAEVAAFVADESADAYPRLVDRLLASPHYGEHWGRLWLDVVRYAETAGFNADPLRPHAWKYRDYVIAALNADLPFDRFLQEQVAGDELFPDDPRALIGSGYVLMWPDESNASNILLARQEALNDLTANIGSALLGLSIGCAQCHDHKFDPLPQKDFYRLQAFFSGLVRREEAPVASTEALVEHRVAMDRWLNESAAVRDELKALEYDARVLAAGDRRMKFPAIVLEALDTLAENRDTLQRQLAFWSERQIEIRDADVEKHLNAEQKARRNELKKQLAELLARRPHPASELTGMVAGEIESIPPKTFLLAGGSYDKPLTEVTPGFLSVLFPAGTNTDALVDAPHPYTSGRRSALARWLTDPRHPLVPRVIVNRIWQGHFGRGLVENGNDFGLQTAPPTHPELLDWLTAEFLAPTDVRADAADANGRLPGAWSLKRLHRLMVTSAAYQQQSYSDSIEAPGAAIDPGNSLYWHFSRKRLSAESLRDALLAVSGQLNPTLHGPSVYPELPPDYSRREAWKTNPTAADRNRRSIYIHAKRNLPYPLLDAFDLPDMHESCARRTQTTVAPQALMLLNSDLVLGIARSFAGRLLYDHPEGDSEPIIRNGFQLAFGRDPTPADLATAREFLLQQQAEVETRRAAGESILLPRTFPKFLDPARGTAIVDFCHALLSASEFLYVD
jgi:hypothetical protein